MSARVRARQERAQLQADVLARARELGFPLLVALAGVRAGARVKPKPIASGEGPWRRHIKTASRAELRTTLQRLGVFDRTARRAVRQLEAGEPVRITPQTIDVGARVLGLVQKPRPLYVDRWDVAGTCGASYVIEAILRGSECVALELEVDRVRMPRFDPSEVRVKDGLRYLELGRHGMRALPDGKEAHELLFCHPRTRSTADGRPHLVSVRLLPPALVVQLGHSRFERPLEMIFVPGIRVKGIAGASRVDRASGVWEPSRRRRLVWGLAEAAVTAELASVSRVPRPRPHRLHQLG